MNIIRCQVTLPVTVAIMLGVILTTTGFTTVLAYESSQAGSLANACGNADLGSFNILCQNLFSEIQGDGNAVNLIGLQKGGERTTSSPPSESPTTGTLKVIKQVECSAGVTCPDPSDFGMEVFMEPGNNPNPATFDGSSSGIDVDIAGSYSVDETVPTLPSGQTLTATKSADCSGTITAGESKTCTITNTITIAATLLVITKVECAQGEQCPNLPIPSDFQMFVFTDNNSPSFPGSAEGTPVTIEPGDYDTGEAAPIIDGLIFDDFLFSPGCTSSQSGPIQAGEERTCTWTNIYRPEPCVCPPCPPGIDCGCPC